VHSAARNILVLLVTLMLAFIVIVNPIRNYFREQSRLAELKGQLSLAEQEREYYEGEVARWSDDKFIIAYAREHYALIMPGEMAMHIADPDSAGNAKDLNDFSGVKKADLDQALALSMQKYKTPWYERIAKSMQSVPAEPPENPQPVTEGEAR
jgi:cell division protein FtsB